MKWADLERGKLYQLRFGREWIVAEYLSRIPAHQARGYRNGKTTWHEPAAHAWKGVTQGSLRVYEAHMEVRPMSEELLSEVSRVQAKIEQLVKERAQAWTELKSLCE